MLSGHLKQYRVPAMLMAGTPLVLAMDARWPSLVVQALLGAVCTRVLVVLSRGLSLHQRQAVWVCVGVATLIELFGSVFWGVYRYRLHNVPLFVPPGHGLVYLCGLRLAVTPLFARRPRVTVRFTLAVAGAWAAFGLLISPWLLGRTDVLGAFFAIYFAYFVLRTRRAAFFAAIFFLTSWLELWGTGLGDWAWVAHAPGIGVGSGNPPSVIAGAYCVLDAIVIVLCKRYAQKADAVAPAAAA